MNNDDLPMHIHKRLKVDVDLRMCAGILIEKVTWELYVELFGQ